LSGRTPKKIHVRGVWSMTRQEALKKARELRNQIIHATSAVELARLWDENDAILKIINGAFETGFYIGEAYRRLWEIKSILLENERILEKKAWEL
jgi:hypothetical protein